ncbi:MAG: hypothetical protein RL094_561 [Candidatus Parcubacteria bacterium]|jgi:hypothetical protein
MKIITRYFGLFAIGTLFLFERSVSNFVAMILMVLVAGHAVAFLIRVIKLFYWKFKHDEIKFNEYNKSATYSLCVILLFIFQQNIVASLDTIAHTKFTRMAQGVQDSCNVQKICPDATDESYWVYIQKYKVLYNVSSDKKSFELKSVYIPHERISFGEGGVGKELIVDFVNN